MAFRLCHQVGIKEKVNATRKVIELKGWEGFNSMIFSPFFVFLEKFTSSNCNFSIKGFVGGAPLFFFYHHKLLNVLLEKHETCLQQENDERHYDEKWRNRSITSSTKNESMMMKKWSLKEKGNRLKRKWEYVKEEGSKALEELTMMRWIKKGCMMSCVALQTSTKKLIRGRQRWSNCSIGYIYPTFTT